MIIVSGQKRQSSNEIGDPVISCLSYSRLPSRQGAYSLVVFVRSGYGARSVNCCGLGEAKRNCVTSSGCVPGNCKRFLVI